MKQSSKCNNVANIDYFDVPAKYRESFCAFLGKRKTPYRKQI